MRWVVAVLLTGCESVFPLEAPIDAPPVQKPICFEDDFTGPALDPIWTASGGTVVADGTLSIATKPAGGSADVNSSPVFDLVDASVEIELVETPTEPQRSLVFQINFLPGGAYAFFEQTASELEFWGHLEGVIDMNKIGFDPVAHHWLRISDVGDHIEFQSSPDGLGWTTQARSGGKLMAGGSIELTAFNFSSTGITTGRFDHLTIRADDCTGRGP